MKKILLLSLLVISLISCEKEVTPNVDEYQYVFEVISEGQKGDSIRIVDLTNNEKGQFQLATGETQLTFNSKNSNVVFGLEIKNSNGLISLYEKQIFIK